MTQRNSAQKYLEKLHTRQLLKLRDRVYRVCNYGLTHGFQPVYDVTDTLSVRAYEIKRELSKREHIPNKAEAKKIRQEKAKKR
jgi:hypothetical protein